MIWILRNDTECNNSHSLKARAKYISEVLIYDDVIEMQKKWTNETVQNTKILSQTIIDIATEWTTQNTAI